MKKILKKNLQLFLNFLSGLRNKPIETIKFTLITILIKQFYKSFAWLITLMIFGPSFFDENPFESIKDILNWMFNNLNFTYSYILVKAQNLINELIRSLTNWDIPNVEYPKIDKKSIPTESEKILDSEKKTTLQSQIESEKTTSEKREDPETFINYRKSWDRDRFETSNNNLNSRWWENTNWTYVIIGTVLVGVIIGSTYYSWDSISTFVPSAANTVWQNVRYVKNFIWRSRDAGEGPDNGDSSNTAQPYIFRPDNGISLSDNRTIDKGKGVDWSILSRTMSQEEISEINPRHEFQNREASTSENKNIQQVETSSESSSDSSSSSNGGITISNFKKRANKYFREENDNFNAQAEISFFEDDFDEALMDGSNIADIIESKNPDIDTMLPNPRDFREVNSDEVLPHNIIGSSCEPISDTGKPLKRYIAHGQVIFRDENNIVYDYNSYLNKLVPLNPRDIPYSIARLIRNSSSNNEIPLSDSNIDWSNIPKIIVTDVDEDDSKTITNDKNTNDDSHLSSFPFYPQIKSARLLNSDETVDSSVTGSEKTVPKTKDGKPMERILINSSLGSELVYKIYNKEKYLKWNKSSDKFEVLTLRNPLIRQIKEIFKN